MHDIESHVHLDGKDMLEHGPEHDHEHEHGHEHTHGGAHPHVHTNKKAIMDRLSRAKGHLESVISMIDNDRDCAEVLIQIAAVRNAISNAGKVLLQDHISECVKEAVINNDQSVIDELNKAIGQFVK